MLYLKLDSDSFEIMEILKSRPEIAELQNEVKTNKWEELGIQLGLQYNDLVAIRKQFSDTIGDCRREMFALWIQTSTTPSRDQLLQALKSKAVAEIDMAKQYEAYIHSHLSQLTRHTIQGMIYCDTLIYTVIL